MPNPWACHCSVPQVACCKRIESRARDNNNSDEFIEAEGSTITDTFISTGDDAIKAYRDISPRNAVIEQRRNVAPIQFGSEGDCRRSKAAFENLTTRGLSMDKHYRHLSRPSRFKG